MHQSVLDYCKKEIKKEMITDKAVIEIGSKDVCGSAQPYVKSFSPKSYIGIDIDEGEGVDLVIYAEDLLKHFEENSIDFILNNECMEHVEDWKIIVSNMKKLLKPGGYLLITTRSKGFAYHAWPYDFWRYEVSDMQNIFSDMNILNVISDPECPGVFIIAQKPINFIEKNIVDYKMYSIVKWQRLKSLKISDITKFDITKNRVYYNFRFKIANLFPQVWKRSIKNLVFNTKN